MIDTKKAYLFLLKVYLLALPLGAMSIGTFGSMLKVIAIFPVIMGLLNIKTFINSKCITLFFIYVVYAVISVIYSFDKSNSVTLVTSLLLLFILLVSSCCFEYSPEEIDGIKSILHLSSLLSAFICLIFGTYSYGRLLIDTGNLQEDPNGFCLYLSFGLIYSLEKILTKNSISKKIIYSAEIVLYLVICFLTGSRGGFLALFVGSFLFIIAFGERTLNIKKIILLLFVVGVVYIILTNLSGILSERFSIQSISESGGTGRIEIWKNALTIFASSSFERKLFGFGINSTRSVFIDYGVARKSVMHNMYIGTLFELGIIGIIIYISMLFEYVKASFRFKSKFAFGVIMCMLAGMLTLSIPVFKAYFNCLIFILISQRVFYPQQLPERDT